MAPFLLASYLYIIFFHFMPWLACSFFFCPVLSIIHSIFMGEFRITYELFVFIISIYFRHFHILLISQWNIKYYNQFIASQWNYFLENKIEKLNKTLYCMLCVIFNLAQFVSIQFLFWWRHLASLLNAQVIYFNFAYIVPILVVSSYF